MSADCRALASRSALGLTGRSSGGEGAASVDRGGEKGRGQDVGGQGQQKQFDICGRKLSRSGRRPEGAGLLSLRATSVIAERRAWVVSWLEINHSVSMWLILAVVLVTSPLILGFEGRSIRPGESIIVSVAANSFHQMEIQANGSRLELRSGSSKLLLGAAQFHPASTCWISLGEGPSEIEFKSLEEVETRSFFWSIESGPIGPGDDARAAGCKLLAEAGTYFEYAGPALARSQLRTLNEALKLFEAAGDLALQAETQTALGQSNFNLGKPVDGLAAHERAVELWGQAQNAVRRAHSARWLAAALSSTNRTARAREVLLEVQSVGRKSGQAWLEAAALLALAAQPAREGRKAEATALFEQAIQLNLATNDRKGEAETQNYFAIFQQNQGFLDEAMIRYRRALELRRQIHDEIGVAQILNNIATVSSRLGDQLDAIATFEEVLAIRQRIATPEAVANTQHNLATEYMLKGDYTRALALFEEALPVWRANSNQFGEAATLTEMAGLFNRTNLKQRAERTYLQALPIQRALKNIRGESATLAGLGACYREQRRFAEAVQSLQSAVAVARQGKFPVEEARGLRGLGEIQSLMGEHTQALVSLRLSLDLVREVSRVDALSNKISLSSALLRCGQAAEAVPLLEEALSFSREIQNSLEELGSLYGLAQARFALGETDAALAHANAAMDLTERQILKVASDQTRALATARYADIYSLGAQILVRSGQPKAAFEAAERGRARILVDLMSKAKVEPNTATPLLEEERRLRSALNAKAERLTRLLLASAKPSETGAVRKAISRLIDEHAAIEERIARQDPRFAKLAMPVSIEAVQRQLQVGEALWEFSLGVRDSLLWIVTKDSLDTRRIGPRAELEALASKLREALHAPLKNPSGESIESREARLNNSRKNAAALAAQLAKLLPAQPGGKLYIVPDGELHNTAFAVLPAFAKKALVTLPSASLLVHLPSGSAGQARLAVFADPVYEAHDSRLRTKATLRSPGEEVAFPRLRFSLQEAEAISTLAPANRRKISTGFAATRQAALATPLASYDVLHFATHAEWNQSNPELSGIVLSMFSESGRPTNGYLRLNDIAHWRLSSQLVVLSACETALGQQLKGEGTMGLSRSFLSAGAGGIVASLWAVDDAATATFMRAFYEGYLNRAMLPSAAIAHARTVVQSQPKWTHPFFWAGFVYTGAS